MKPLGLCKAQGLSKYRKLLDIPREKVLKFVYIICNMCSMFRGSHSLIWALSISRKLIILNSKPGRFYGVASQPNTWILERLICIRIMCWVIELECLYFDEFVIIIWGSFWNNFRAVTETEVSGSVQSHAPTQCLQVNQPIFYN